MNTKHATRPTIDRIHADALATRAAVNARKLGATPAQAAKVHASAYADAMRGQR